MHRNFFSTQCPLVRIWNFCFKEPETVSQQSQIIFPLVASLHGMKKYRDETLTSPGFLENKSK